MMSGVGCLRGQHYHKFCIFPEHQHQNELGTREPRGHVLSQLSCKWLPQKCDITPLGFHGRLWATKFPSQGSVRGIGQNKGHGNGHEAWHCRGRDGRHFYLSCLQHYFVLRHCFGKLEQCSCVTRLDTSDVTLMRWASVQSCGPCALHLRTQRTVTHIT